MTIQPQPPFPSALEYVLAQRCPSCKAAPGVDCNAPSKFRETEQLWRQHAVRVEAGREHYKRDLRNAPSWPEGWELGKSYGTVSPVSDSSS